MDEDELDHTAERPARRAPEPSIAERTAARGAGGARLVAPPRAADAPPSEEDLGLLDTAARGSTVPEAGAGGDRLVGRVLKNQYRVVRKLGAGGMGSVYLAHNLEFDERVAVKFLSLEGPNSAAALARFRAEQETLRVLRESRIVKARGDGVTEDGEPFIVMEFVQGTPLNDLLHQGREDQRRVPAGQPVPPCIAPPRMLRVMIDVCIALEEAHAHRIIHRDLKPANMVVERSTGGFETTKVLDFGIAKALNPVVNGGDAAPATATGMIIGTVAYLSPEQANAVDVVPQSDLYSLGATAFHCLTGELPFSGQGMAVLHHHVHTPPPSFAEVRPELERSPLLDRLEAIVMRLLEKRPQDRFQTARELREALEGLLTLEREDAGSPSVASTASGVAVPPAVERPKTVAVGADATRGLDTARPETSHREAAGASAPTGAATSRRAVVVAVASAVGVIGVALALSRSPASTAELASPASSAAPSTRATAAPGTSATAAPSTSAAAAPSTSAAAASPGVSAPNVASATPSPRASTAPVAAGPQLTVRRAVMLSAAEQAALERAVRECYRKVGASAAHTVRLGGVGRVVVESIRPAHPALEACVASSLSNSTPSSALGSALELEIRR